MSDTPRATRPKDVKADPRTDGVDDLGMYDLDPLSDEEISEGFEHDQSLAETGELTRVKMRPIEEAEGETW